MFKLVSPEALLEAFRPEDRAEVELPQDARFPMGVRDYLTWSEPSGHRVFVVFADSDPKKPLGIVFKREGSSSGAGVAGMCDWCHFTSGGGGVALLTAVVNPRRRVGVSVCRDLSCAQKAMGLNGKWGPDGSLEDLHAEYNYPQGMSGHERVRRVVQKMSEFARRNLF
jgi:hypothetical protein